jgi:hypothetical protein
MTDTDEATVSPPSEFIEAHLDECDSDYERELTFVREYLLDADSSAFAFSMKTDDGLLARRTSQTPEGATDEDSLACLGAMIDTFAEARSLSPADVAELATERYEDGPD